MFGEGDARGTSDRLPEPDLRCNWMALPRWSSWPARVAYPWDMRTLAAVLLLSASASAQSFNIDLGGSGVPSPGYVGAAGYPPGGWNESPLPGVGPWNAVPLGGGTPLISTTGLATGVTITSTATTSSFASTGGTLTGDDRELMLDGEVTAPGVTTTYTISGLSQGQYTVYTYAWNPEDQSALTRVTMLISVDPAFDVGGPWNGSPHAFRTTFAYQESPVSPGGTIRLTVEGVGGPGVVNGFQIRGSPSGASFCWGDGSGTACPCGNSTLRPRGCGNSVHVNGAELTTYGIPRVSHDTLRLDAFGMPPSTNGLFFQGTSQVAAGLGVPFGDGLRCVGGTIVRLGIFTAGPTGGASNPQAGGAPLSVAGSVAAGDVRHFQVWYRNADPAWCTPATFNLTNGVTVVWQP